MDKISDNVTKQILEIAQRKWRKLGYREVSIYSICSEVGVTTGAFYRRFTGKEEVLDMILKPILEEFRYDLKKQLDKTDNSSFSEWYLSFMYSHLNAFGLLIKCLDIKVCKNYFEQIKNIAVCCIMEQCDENPERIKQIISVVINAYMVGSFEIMYNNYTFNESKKCLGRLNIFFEFR